MARYCSNCGSQISEGAHYCPSCGALLPQTPPAPGPQAPGAAPPAEASPAATPPLPAPQPPAAAPPAPPPAVAPPAPPPPPATPATRAAPPPGPPPPGAPPGAPVRPRGPAPPPGHGIPPKYIAAGGGAAAAAVIAALVVFLLGSGGGTSKAKTPSTTTPPPPVPTSTTTPTTTTTTSTTTTGGGCGTLQSCLPPTVENGTFTLDQGSVQKDTTLIGNGASDAIDAKYFDSSNNEVDVFIAAFPDSTSLQNQVNTTVNNLNKAGCNQANTGSFTDNSGKQFNTSDFDCSGSSQNISPAWTVFAGTSNGLFGEVAGPGSPSDSNTFVMDLVLGQ